VEREELSELEDVVTEVLGHKASKALRRLVDGVSERKAIAITVTLPNGGRRHLLAKCWMFLANPYLLIDLQRR
jgi:hypothetical protein